MGVGVGVGVGDGVSHVDDGQAIPLLEAQKPAGTLIDEPSLFTMTKSLQQQPGRALHDRQLFIERQGSTTTGEGTSGQISQIGLSRVDTHTPAGSNSVRFAATLELQQQPRDNEHDSQSEAELQSMTACPPRAKRRHAAKATRVTERI